MAKGLKGIDYRTAFEAMIKDAETPPADDEKEGRGGLHEYNTLGYIPYGIPRAGTRTVEYSYDDWCIAQVAKGLGIDSLYNRYLSRSHNWKNLLAENRQLSFKDCGIQPELSEKNQAYCKEMVNLAEGLFTETAVILLACLRDESEGGLCRAFCLISKGPVVFGKRLKAESHLATVFLTLYMALEVFCIIERVLVILVNDIA